jgi:DNA-nicking Smr family endonuclease
MKKPGKPASGRKRHLSEDDEVLWSHTARTLEPLKRAKSRVHTATEALELALQADTGTSAKRHPDDGVKSVAVRPLYIEPIHRPDREPPVLAKAPPLNDFDKRKARKLGAGQIAIDARIDLHGMRQSEAHIALRKFLFSAYSQGHRWVLVITGKGARQHRDRDDETWNFAPVEPGVLKRNVPGWLGEPELRAIVVSFKTAAARHGGEGALYVHLRNAERAVR